MTDTQNKNGSTDPEEVWKVAATCRIHWRMKGVPDARADEMEEELANHLREAVRRGGSVEDVVGHDTLAFAEEWAEEARAERSVLGWAAELGWALTGGVGFVAVGYHLFRWSSSFGVEAAAFVPVMIFAWFASVPLLSGLTEKQRTDPQWMKWMRAFASVSVIFGPYAVIWAVTGERTAELFEWSWVYTLVALAASVALGRLGKRSVGQK